MKVRIFSERAPGVLYEIDDELFFSIPIFAQMRADCGTPDEWEDFCIPFGPEVIEVLVKFLQVAKVLPSIQRLELNTQPEPPAKHTALLNGMSLYEMCDVLVFADYLCSHEHIYPLMLTSFYAMARVLFPLALEGGAEAVAKECRIALTPALGLGPPPPFSLNAPVAGAAADAGAAGPADAEADLAAGDAAPELAAGT